MKEIEQLRAVVGDDETAQFALKVIEELLVVAEANAVRLESMRAVVDGQQPRGTRCPFCHRARGHAETCYLRSGTGFDLLAEHEATLRENDELRRALAPHLGKTAQAVLTGKPYEGIKARFRRRHAKRRAKGSGS